MKNGSLEGRAARDRIADCSDVTIHLWSFLDRELSVRGAASMRAHLRECASCRGYVRFERAFLRVLRASRRPPREP